MAINWSWKDKMGTITKVYAHDGKEFIHNLYDCNGLFVEVAEWEAEDGIIMYSLADFAVDEEHFKRCIADNLLDSYYEFHLNIAYKKAKKIAKILLEEQSKGRWNGTLITYYEEVE